MRVWALFILLAACQRSPYDKFDAGYPVHVIVHADGVSAKGFRIRPVSTLGPMVHESRPRVVRERAASVEVARFESPAGDYRFSFFERGTRVAGRADVAVDREVWIVVTMTKGTARAAIKVHDKPPHDALGHWRPYVAVPD